MVSAGTDGQLSRHGVCIVDTSIAQRLRTAVTVLSRIVRGAPAVFGFYSAGPREAGTGRRLPRRVRHVTC
jgi:hypothetical protein